MKTHDYTEQFWGHAISSFHKKSDTVLSMMGHGDGIKKGDLLTMKMQSGRIGKFKVLTVSYFSDPSDMWQLDAEFQGYQEATAA
jgi:hypothetical protein